MKIGIQNSIVSAYPETTQIEMIARAGFDCIDWNFFSLYLSKQLSKYSVEQTIEYYTNLRKCIDDNNLEVCQTHTPYPTYQKSMLNKMRINHVIKLSIIATSLLGAKYTIIHPHAPLQFAGVASRSNRISENIKFYKSLIPLLDEYDVTCCIENMFSWDIASNCACETSCSTASEMREILSRIDHPRFKFCFDSGHANLICGKENMHAEVLTLGSDLATVHLHDNNGKNDLHQAVGSGVIDWDKLMDAFNRVNYKGVYSFEIHSPVLGKKTCEHAVRLNHLQKSLRAFVTSKLPSPYKSTIIMR